MVGNKTMKLQLRWKAFVVCLFSALVTFLPAAGSVAETGTSLNSIALLLGDTLDLDAAGELPAQTLRAGPDTDGDGIDNDVDPDDDNDRISDIDEGLVDANGDGIPDASSVDTDGDGVVDGLDDDSDNDGIPDFDEAVLNFNAGIFTPIDTDGDGVEDFRDLNSDDDNIFDLVEAGGTDNDGDGRVDNFTDTSGKGIDDALLTNSLPVFDTDADGLHDYRDLDSDDDGIPDLVEAGANPPNLPADTDGDGAADYRENDSDDDGISDTVEAGPNPASPVDTDGDGAPDFADTDSDNDGIADGAPMPDSDGDGVPNQLDLDDDNDGILDTDEGQIDADGNGFADPASTDTDGDGTPDGLDLDSDNDGILDLIERSTNVGAILPLDLVVNGAVDIAFPVGANGVPDALETSVDSGVLVDGLSDFDGDGVPDFRDLDSDDDSIFDLIEAGGVDADGNGTIDGFIDADGKGVDDGVQSSALPLFDTDGDGANDFRDDDSDADTIPDAVEGGGTPNVPLDTDGDGAPDFRETDSDGDSIPDADEAGGNPAAPIDTDGDGSPDFQDLDSDDDGTLDGVAAPVPTPPATTPTVTGPDTDGDGIPNQLDLDDDNDGIPDTLEGALDADGDGFQDAGALDTDGDGTPDAFDLDSDNDGILDNEESRLDLALVQSLDQVVNGAIDIGVEVGSNGLADVLETSPDSGVLNFSIVDTDNDGTPDFQDTDSDNDGINDLVEAGGIDADADGQIDNFVDTDGKGVDDAVQVNALPVFDTDGDGLADFRDSDSDADTIPDSVEAGSVPNMPVDTDGDGAPDFRETDSDADTIPDNIEAGPAPSAPVDTDADGTPDFQDLDSDNDTVPDADEAPTAPVAPTNPDMDGDGVMNVDDLDDDNDGVLDVDEGPGDMDGDAVANQFDLDSDNDGVFDIQEASDDTTQSMTLDVDDDGMVDGTSFGDNGFADALETAPESGVANFPISDADSDGVADFLDVDSDNDSIFDSIESGHPDANVDGQIDGTGTISPFGVLDGTGGPFVDSDGDGVVDFRDLDSDNDGLPDLVEAGGADVDGDGRIDGFTDTDGDGGNDLQDSVPVIPPDTDGDQILDFRDLDSDNDGLSDILEIGGPSLDLDNDGEIDNFTDANADGLDDAIAAAPLILLDTDGDSFADNVDLDSDGDGLFDIAETGGIDANNDGVVDNLSDSDGDGVPDVVDSDATGGVDSDLDSIDDAFDASITGGSDMDGDDIIDSADPDADGDGFSSVADDGASSNQNLPDSDGDGVLDFQEIDGTITPTAPTTAVLETGLSATGFGCAVSTLPADQGKRSFDPLFLLLLAVSGLWFARSLITRRRNVLRSESSAVSVKPVRPSVTLAAIFASLFLVSCGSIGGGDFGSDNTGHKGRIYIGAGLGVSRLEPDPNNQPGVSVADENSAGGQLTLGYDVSNRFSVEGHIADLGEAEISPAGDIGYTTAGVSGLLYFLNDEVDRGRREGWNLFGRLGIGALNNQADIVQFDRVNDFHLLAGLGVEYGFGFGLGIRGEFISFDEDAQYAQLGLVYRFGSPGYQSAARTASPAPIAAPLPQSIPLQEPLAEVALDSDNDGVADALDNCPGTALNAPVDGSGCAFFNGVIEGVNFETGSARLTDDASLILEGVSATMLQNPDIRVTIEAHTDNRGSASSNLELSKQRAISVAKFLVDRGIAGSRLQPQAFGESQPRASNATADGRLANRRVEFNSL